MKLTGKQISYLRGQAHHRKVIVAVGDKGISEAVMTEVETALESHELLKIKLPAGGRAEKKQVLQSICERSGAAQVQLIGRVGVIYRAAEKAKLDLP